MPGFEKPPSPATCICLLHQGRRSITSRRATRVLTRRRRPFLRVVTLTHFWLPNPSTALLTDWKYPSLGTLHKPSFEPLNRVLRTSRELRVKVEATCISRISPSLLSQPLSCSAVQMPSGVSTVVKSRLDALIPSSAPARSPHMCTPSLVVPVSVYPFSTVDRSLTHETRSWYQLNLPNPQHSAMHVLRGSG